MAAQIRWSFDDVHPLRTRVYCTRRQVFVLVAGLAGRAARDFSVMCSRAQREIVWSVAYDYLATGHNLGISYGNAYAYGAAVRAVRRLREPRSDNM